MTEPTTLTENGVVAELAAAAADPSCIDIDGRRVLTSALPTGWTHHIDDLQHLEAAPHRKRGAIKVRDTASLLTYIDTQIDDTVELPIFYDPEMFQATAVFNGHTMGSPGWGDHRCQLQLQATDEWKAWTRADREFYTAGEFAEFIEEWRHTIADPPTADLLDMVRSFRATTKVSFRQEVVEKSGDRALEYVTETEAAAGAKGTLEIPDGFGLVLAPFDGATPRPLPARFRYRLTGSQALFGVVLEQPAQVAKAAFDAELDRIRGHAPLFVLINGQP